MFFKRKKVWLAVFFGVLPDTIAWVPYFFYRLFLNGFKFERPQLLAIPDWVYFMYGLGHSIVICAAVFLIVYILNKKIPYYMWAWPVLHIATDVPTHSRDFLPTPFLWPISEWSFPGFSWGTPWFMITNYSLLLTFFVYRIMQKKKSKF